MKMVRVFPAAGSLVLAMVVATAGHAENVRFVNGFKVVDATGKRLGKIIQKDAASVLVAAKVGSDPIVLTVGENAIFGDLNVLYFNSSDCSGPAYTSGGSFPVKPFFPLTTIMGPPGMTLYLRDESATPITLPGPATFSERDYPTGTCSVVVDVSGTILQPVRAITNFASTFTPPFGLK